MEIPTINPGPAPWGWKRKALTLLVVTLVLLAGAVLVVWLRVDPYATYQRTLARAGVTRVELDRVEAGRVERVASIREPARVEAWVSALTQGGDPVEAPGEIVPAWQVSLYANIDEVVTITVGTDGLARYQFAGQPPSRVRFGNAQLMALIRAEAEAPQPEAP